MDMQMDVAEDPQNRVSMKIGMEIDMTMAVNASGSAVKVSYPANLSQFPELIGGADGPTGIISSTVA